MPALLKPAASDLILFLWALHYGQRHNIEAAALPEPPREGLTSAPADPKLPPAFYRPAGYHHCGKRVVRIDMLERLADMIRPLIAWRPAKPATQNVKKDDKDEGKEPEAKQAQPEQKESTPPAGATGNGGFRVTPDMMSIIGCSGEEFASVLTALGFRCQRRPLPSPQQEPAPKQETATAADDDGKATETSQVTAETAIPPPIRAMDEIWRPRRKTPRGVEHKGRRHDAKTSGRKQGRPHKGSGARGKGKGGNSRPAKPERPARRKAPEKPLDPDSPFAALKDLKRDLETRVKDGA
jgi:ATP-dependent RNA helicase SUPV3L1/SUV3